MKSFLLTLADTSTTLTCSYIQFGVSIADNRFKLTSVQPNLITFGEENLRINEPHDPVV